MKEKIMINGKEEEIYIVTKDEIEDNSDLINLEDTIDLSGVIQSE